MLSAGVRSVVQRGCARSLSSTGSSSVLRTGSRQWSASSASAMRGYAVSSVGALKSDHAWSSGTFAWSNRVHRATGSMSSFQFPQRMYCDAPDVIVEVPPMGDSISEGTLETWEIDVGGHANADDLVCTVETDKVAQEIRAPQSGKITEHFAEEGETVKVGAKLFSLQPGEGSGEEAQASKSDDGAEKQEAEKEEEKPASSEKKSSSSSESASSSKSEPATPKKETSSTQESASSTGGKSREERRVPMNRMRKRIATRLKDSQNTYAALTTFNEIDMSGIMSLRSKYKDQFLDKHGVKLGFMSAFLKASATALMEMPAVNGVIDGDDIVYRDYADISVAVATPKGLVVPVVRNVESLDYAGIEKEIGRLGGLARDNKLAMEDMAGGTFTVSNGGVFGSLMGTPIINPPQSAILGMHKTQVRPVVVDGEIVARPMMYVALTYDHRLIDGREAVTFLVRVKELVEDPARLVLG